MDWEAVIGDLGLLRCLLQSSVLEREEESTMKPAGTPYYMAPELIDVDRHYGSSVGVFAFGVLVYAMFAKTHNLSTLLDNGADPSSATALWRHIAAGVRYERLDDIPAEYWKLITQCWSSRPANRPTFHEIVRVMTVNVDAFIFPGANESQVRAYAESVCPAQRGTVPN
jgi:serine/threonine protein kinase